MPHFLSGTFEMYSRASSFTEPEPPVQVSRKKDPKCKIGPIGPKRIKDVSFAPIGKKTHLNYRERFNTVRISKTVPRLFLGSIFVDLLLRYSEDARSSLQSLLSKNKLNYLISHSFSIIFTY